VTACLFDNMLGDSVHQGLIDPQTQQSLLIP
jgi:hypothetical protein